VGIVESAAIVAAAIIAGDGRDRRSM